MLPVVILAGGLATRMKPITEKIPKSLIEVNGKPFIIHQLNYLKSQGIQSVVLCIGHLGGMIQSLIGSGESLGLNIRYSLDGDKLLGTGGAIKKSLPLATKDFFVLYGDSFLPIHYKSVEDAYFLSKKNALITVVKNNNQWDRSNVEFEVKTRDINIYSIKQLKISPLEINLQIHVSSGTYIRKIVQDLGEELKIPLVVQTLKRLSIGKFRSEEHTSELQSH